MTSETKWVLDALNPVCPNGHTQHDVRVDHYSTGDTRYSCLHCGEVYTEPKPKPIQCPKGHSNRFVVLMRESTLVHTPEVVDGYGRRITSDNNVHTTTYRCHDCREVFTVKRKNGKIVSY